MIEHRINHSRRPFSPRFEPFQKIAGAGAAPGPDTDGAKVAWKVERRGIGDRTVAREPVPDDPSEETGRDVDPGSGAALDSPVEIDEIL